MNVSANLSGLTNLTDLANVTGNASWYGDTFDVAKEFLPLVVARLWDLVAAPFRYQEMLWIIFPLLLTFLVLEFYFDRHGDEELGWTAAVANSLILFIVAIDLLRHSFPGSTPWQVLAAVWTAIFTEATLPLAPQIMLLILFIGALGIAITIINYYHLLPKSVAFQISSHPPVNFLAFLAIAIVYTYDKEHAIPLDLATLVAAAILYVLLLLLVFMVRLGMRRIFAGTSRSWWSS